MDGMVPDASWNLLQVYRYKQFDAQLQALEPAIFTLENRPQALALRRYFGSAGLSRTDIFRDASVLSDISHTNTSMWLIP